MDGAGRLGKVSIRPLETGRRVAVEIEFEGRDLQEVVGDGDMDPLIRRYIARCGSYRRSGSPRTPMTNPTQPVRTRSGVANRRDLSSWN